MIEALWRKLWRHRRLLGVGAAAIVAAHLLAGWSVVVPAGLCVLLVASVLVVGEGEDHAGEGAGSAMADDLQRLPAEHLAAAVADPLILFDRTASVVHANAAAFVAFGSMAPGLSLPLKFRAPEMQALLDAVLSGSAGAGSIDYAEKLPMERAYRVSASAIGHGSPLYVLIFKDQSETRRIDRMRADFIANASHELRTPLASIAGFIETLRGPARNDAAAREKFLVIMQEQTTRMARLIDDLLSLSRLEMKPYLAPGAEVDIARVVNSVIDSLAPLASDNAIVVERHFDESIAPVPGNRDELFQVFENLFENACKYGQPGGRVVVSIAQGFDGPMPTVEITVRDFGPGIAEEHIPRITERFYRIDADSGTPRKGTGLGLAIVKHILTRHNGRLSVTSELGRGAAFTVHLPAK